MYNQNELYHHGILGQRWGVRRYQNSDGSLTSEGKKRYQGYDHKSNLGKKFAIGVGAAVAVGAVGYAVSTGRINVGSILKNIGTMSSASVPKKPSKATKAIVEANKQFASKSLAKKPSKATTAIIEANRQFTSKSLAKKPLVEATRKIGTKKVTSAQSADTAELLKDINKIIKDNKSFNLHIIDTNASLREQADQFLSVYDLVKNAG